MVGGRHEPFPSPRRAETKMGRLCVRFVHIHLASLPRALVEWDLSRVDYVSDDEKYVCKCAKPTYTESVECPGREIASSKNGRKGLGGHRRGKPVGTSSGGMSFK